MEDPLCVSSLGSMVSLDYVNPLTFCSAGACAGAAARVCPVSSSSAVSAVVHAHATTLHGAHNSWSEGVSPLKGINNALFQVPSSCQFQFPDVLEAEFRQRVVGPERMLRVRDSLQAKRPCASEEDLNDSVSEVESGRVDCASEPGCNGLAFEVGSGTEARF